VSSRASYKDRIHERQRLLQVYDVFLRYGADGAFDRGALGEFRRWIQSRLYGVHLEPLSSPEKARLMLQELGPTYVKLGQIVSSRADALPTEWEQELSKLQSDVRPFPVQEAREVIAAELGAPPEELYESFDPKPLAAASLGQVHRAVLEGGRPVVVKVQRPNIEQRVKSDLRILTSAAGVMERRTAWAHDVGLQRVVEEFGASLLLELDYRLEAYNARRLAENLQSIPGVGVPEVIRELSRTRVLTLEFIEGVPANRREEIIAAGLDPTEIADNAVRAAVKMILIDGFFHADPHPGNVMVNLKSGMLTFIDTGMVGEIDMKRRMNLVGLMYTATKGEPLALAQSLRSLSEPFRETNPSAFDQEFARRLGPLMDVGEGEKMALAEIISQSLDMLRDAGYRPDPQLSLAMKAMTQAEEFMRVLYPPGSSSTFADSAVDITRTLATESLTQERIAEFARKQALHAGREALQNVPSLQEATGMWLKQYKKGRFEVTVDTSKLEPHIESLRGITQTLVVGLLTVGILISSAIAASVPEDTGVKGMHTVADIGYAASLVLAVVLVVSLLARARPGRKR
jgi:ubiquinone biosynthesis protein